MKYLTATDDFKIIQFTDLHLGKHRYTTKNSDTIIIEDVTAMIKDEKPQLIVFTGDNIDGEYCDDAKSLFRDFFKNIDELKTPWVLIFGNHGETGNSSKKELMEVLSKFNYCLSEPGPANVHGVGNFHIPIKNQEIEFSLYFLDYGSINKEFKYDWIHETQIQWFKQITTKYKKIPAFIFFHIPLKEFDQTKEIYQGKHLEDVDPSRHKTNFFDEIVNAKNIVAVFCGHEHYNNYCTKYKGINLCYGQNSGFDFYDSKLPRKRGARITTIDFNDKKTLHTNIKFFPTTLE